MKKILVSLSLFVCITVSAQQKEVAAQFGKTITAKELKKKLSVIASAEMEGRETATEGQKRAAAYIEGFFKKAGLKPAIPNEYQINFPVYQDSLETARLSINGRQLSAGNDFLLNGANLSSNTWKAGEVIFASYGLDDSLHHNYDGLDVKDKWVLVLEGMPENMQTPARMSPARMTAMKMARARSKGAVGMIVVTDNFIPAANFERKGNMYNQPSRSTLLPVITVPAQTAATILQKPVASFKSLKDFTRGIYDTKLELTTIVKTLNLESSNVLAVIPGTDKKDEYVFITSHYDHLGKKDSVIYYGADDDGSGTASVMQIAEAFAKAKAKGKAPRRTIVFMTVSGEEKGLWGSEYYADHPVFPLAKTSVNLNIDMVGRIDPDYKGDSTNYVYVIGEDKLSSRLLKISDSINQKYMRLELDRRFNDPKDPNRFYYRSDHYNFAKKGIPVIFYFNGVHADYHRPTDTVDKINFDLMEKRVKLVFYTAWAMANEDDMMPRDIPMVN